MGPVAHIILQAMLCSSALRAGPETQIAMRVHAVDRTGRLTFDKTYSVERGYEPKKVVDFEIPWAVYRLDVTMPKYRCAAQDYLVALPDTTRTVTEHLSNGAPQLQTPAMIVAGKAPESFLYAKPTWVVFDKDRIACDKPIPDALPMRVDIENDSDGYYAWIYPDPSQKTQMQLAMRVTTAAHQYHYIRIPMPFLNERHGWPHVIQFNVNEDMIDELSGKPVDTLLCPKLWETSAG